MRSNTTTSTTTPSHTTSSRLAIAIAAALLTSGVALPSLALAQVNSGSNNSGADRDAARAAAVAAARGQMEAAQAQITAATARLTAQYNADPAMIEAEKELQEARAELDRVSAPAYEKLRQSEEYKAALREEQEANQRVASEQQRTNATQPVATQPAGVAVDPQTGQAQPGRDEDMALAAPVPSDSQVDAAMDKLEVVSKRRQLEMNAAAADPQTAEARKRLDAATAKHRALRLEVRARMLNDPEYKAAQERLAAARAEMTRAAAGNY